MPRSCARVPPGGRVLVFNVPYETLYAVTGTTTPGELYANSNRWWWLVEDGVGDRIVANLRAHPETLVLFQEPDPVEDRGLLETSLYRYLRDETIEVERVDARVSWRRAGATAR